MHIIFVISEGQLLSTVFCFSYSSSSFLASVQQLVLYYISTEIACKLLYSIIFLKREKKVIKQKTELNFKIRCVQLVALNIPRGHKTYLQSSAVAQQNEIRIKKLFKILFSRRQKTATVICL